ncbi:chromatin assembly factor 1, p105 subunit [Rhynchophorus ferrugineus]|uniref:chromatin assembly factor 1, p105 subunit n=1 Tax=Rhynchophorus ferrugineus TaxID=354439 RepID=UPI003FCDB92D
MKCTIPEISWHNREPVLSVDIFPENKEFYRLASGGGDCHVLIWQLNITETGAVNQEVISDLTRHQRAVNCVRWSHNGTYLASGDDDANIIVWQLKVDNIPLLEGDTGDKEIWIVYKVLRGHKEDVYDLSWSIDNSKILSGSVDNTAILWDINKGKLDHILSDHKGFVQGVAWDPKNQIIATVSTDRICRIFDQSGKHVKARVFKGKITSVPDDHFLKDKEVKFFYDDTFKSFFRRLSFTPDGSLLIVPSGHIEVNDCKYFLNATLIFTLDNWLEPAAILPLCRQSSTVIRCCPILFELHDDAPDPFIKLPYRMIFAVGTDHDVILYDTQQIIPFARFQDIHYTRLTDLTWSHDGSLLVASSTDGFCTLITFETRELGVPWTRPKSEEKNVQNLSNCDELPHNDENTDIKNKAEETNNEVKEEVKKRPSFLEQWASKTPKRKRLQEKSVPISIEPIIVLDSPGKKENNKPSIEETKKTIRRIAPVRCGEVSSKNKSQQNKKVIKTTSSNVSSQSTASTEKSHNDDKPKARRIAPIKIGEVSKSDSSKPLADSRNKIDDGDKKHEVNSIGKASPDIRSFFSGKSKKKVEVAPKISQKILKVEIVSTAQPTKRPSKRIAPLKIGEVSTTVKVEKKPHNLTVTRQDITECLNDDAVLDEEELKDYKKASGEIQNFFCRRFTNESQKNIECEKQDFMIEDKTEEFSLQLEDSQSSCISNNDTPKKQSESSKSEGALSESNEVKKGIGTPEKTVLPKTPKRLPFKTLASPRTKIKRSEGNKE